MAISNWIITWVDNDDEPHIRLIEGSADEIDEAKKLIRQAYTAYGIKKLRVMITDGNFSPIETLREEVAAEAGNR